MTEAKKNIPTPSETSSPTIKASAYQPESVQSQLPSAVATSESTPSTSDLLKSRVKAKSQQIIQEKTKEQFLNNPLFQDTNPNAAKNKQVYIDHLSKNGNSRSDLELISKATEKAKEISVDGNDYYSEPTEIKGSDKLAFKFAEHTSDAILAGYKQLKEAFADPLLNEQGHPITNADTMHPWTIDIAHPVLKGGIGATTILASPVIAAFDLVTEGIKNAADSTLPEPAAKIVGEALPTIFSLVHKTSDLLGLKSDYVINGKTFTSNELEQLAKKSNIPFDDYLAQKGATIKETNAELIKTLGDMIVGTGVLHGAGKGVEFIKEKISNLSLKDLKESADKLNTPEGDVISSQITKITDKSAEEKNGEHNLHPETETAIDSQAKAHDDLVNSKAETPEQEKLKQSLISDSEAKLNEGSGAHTEFEVNDKITKGLNAAELNHIDSEITPIDEFIKANADNPTAVALAQEKMKPFLERKAEIEGKQIEPHPEVQTNKIQKIINEVSQVPDTSSPTIKGKHTKTKWGDLEGYVGKTLFDNFKDKDISENYLDHGGEITDAGIIDLNKDKYNEKTGDITKIGKQLDELQSQGYIDEFSDGHYGLTQSGKEFIDAVKARIETRKSVNQGTDLFPNEANIPEFKEISNANEIKELTLPSADNLNVEANEISKSIPQGKHREISKINIRNEEVASELRGRIGEARENSLESSEIGARDERQLDNKIAFDYANKTGTWINDIHDLGERFKSGNENTNVFNGSEQKVYKSNNLMNTLSLSKFFDKIKLHNEIFPNTAYKFEGFTGLKDTGRGKPYVEPIYSQDFIKEAAEATPKEIDDYMNRLDFKKVEGEDFKYTNGNIEVSDVRPRNVLKDKSGNIFVIDAEFKQNKPSEKFIESSEDLKSKEEKYPNDPEMTKMANAINDSFIEGKFGTEAMDKIIDGLQDTDIKKIYEDVKVKIKDGVIDPKKVRERVIETRSGSERDQAVLLYDMAELKGKERNLRNEIINETDPKKKQELQNSLIDVQNEMLDNTMANKSIGRSASTIFRIRQVWADRDANLSDMINQYKASKGAKEITPEERVEITKSYEKLRELEGRIKTLESSEKQRQSDFDNLKKENETLKKLIDETKDQRKKDRALKTEEIVKNANKRIQQSRDKIRQITQGQLSSGINPVLAVEISKIAKEHIVKGAAKFDEIVKNVLDDVKDLLPEFTEQDVKDHLAYSKEGKPKSNVSKIAAVVKKTFKLEGKTNKGDFAPGEKKVYTESQELKEAKKQYAIERFKWEQARRLDLLSKRPIGEKIADSVVRWQRFAILSYPSTLLKLMAVVGHGLAMKPIQFATQKLVSKILPDGISKKADIWGEPNTKALAKYYTSFIKNFNLDTLKEHFTGVDAKEVQHGKPFIYEEWNLGKGILEMPGRSHGYIKSFIKTPEFDYAHTLVSENYISKMAEIQNKLEDPNLSDTEVADLKKDYAKYDVSDPDVVEKINKLSLEHGKWSILMNDSKGLSALRGFLNQKSIAGYLLKTELPIVKIPVNFIGRSIATKYGLLRALYGKHDMINGEHQKGLAELMIKGTKDLTPEEANLISRSLTIGTMGATLFALGYMNRDKMEENDDGSWNIGEQRIPKTLLHNPAFESAFSGATTGKRFDEEENHNSAEWIKDFVESDIDVVKKNPFSNMLKYGATGNLISIMNSKKTGDTEEANVASVLGKKVSGMIIPGIVSETSKAFDTERSGYHPFDKEIKRGSEKDETPWEKFMTEVELGTPLRRHVPEK